MSRTTTVAKTKVMANIDDLAAHLAKTLDIDLSDVKNALVGYEPPKENLKFNGLVVYKYSDKSYAVLGETKSCRETLKDTGVCKYSPGLRFGPGWILAMKGLSVLEAALKDKNIRYTRIETEDELRRIAGGEASGGGGPAGRETKGKKASSDDEVAAPPKKGKGKKPPSDEDDDEATPAPKGKGKKPVQPQPSDDDDSETEVAITKKALPKKPR